MNNYGLRSSAFGWVGHDRMPIVGDLIQLGKDEEERIFNAPFITIAGSDPKQLANSLKNQTMTDFRVLDTPLDKDLSVFKATMGRYILAVSTSHFLPDSKFLMRLSAVLLRYQPTVLCLPNGFVIDRTIFLGRDNIPFISWGVFASLYGDVLWWDGELSSPKERYADIFYCKSYRESPLAKPKNNVEREILLSALYSYPTFLPTKDRPGLWTCMANDWYDMRTILREYIGLEADIPINGKVQHGWQSGCGFDGERGFKPDIEKSKFPVYVWNNRNLEIARSEGFSWAQAIGAPIIYRRDILPASMPPAFNKVLAVPYHSVPEYPIASDWRKYARDLLAYAETEGYSGATVCLHYFDFENDSTRNALREEGLAVVTAGGPLTPKFMDRLELLVKEHAAVISDRICTAGLYAEYWNRPFSVIGTALIPNPPDPDYGLGADRDWIAKEMPIFLSKHAANEESKKVALRELGYEFKQTRENLTQTLYGQFI